MSKENFAQPDFDRLQETSSAPKELGKGGGIIKRSKEGAGVRASRLAEGSEIHLHNKMTPEEREKERMRMYRKVVDCMQSGFSEKQLSAIVAQIYEEYAEDLKQGGFLSRDYIRRIITQLACEEAITPEERQSLWEVTIGEL